MIDTVLGYCMFPLVLFALIIAVLASVHVTTILMRGPLVLAGFLWSSWACIGFMGALVEPKRKMLSVYPVVLFYVIIAWLILLSIR